jgi:multiple sugar transport system substrate-binding protein
MKKLLWMFCAGAASLLVGLSAAQAWSLEEAAKDYKGTEIKVIFLDRPGYRAAIEMLPEFEQKTGIKVSYELVPYENSREKEVLDFSAQGDLAIALVDLVWMGEFAESGWIVSVDEIKKKFPRTHRPTSILTTFSALLLGRSDRGMALYGLPFDNYSGLLY